MSERKAHNPYEAMGAVEFTARSFAELPSLAYRMPQLSSEARSLSEREAVYWLDRTYTQAVEGESDVFIEGEYPRLHHKLGAGLSTAVFGFASNNREWAMKMGLSQSLTYGKMDPSTPEFAEWYHYYLEVQQDTYGSRLSHLIPSPQEVYYVSGDQQEGRTVIIQPYIGSFIESEHIADLGHERLEGLLDEVMLFDYLSRQMMHTHRVNPDIIPGRGNLSIAEIADEAHLVLVDNGLSDHNLPNPMLRLLNYATYHVRFTHEVAALKRLLRSTEMI